MNRLTLKTEKLLSSSPSRKSALIEGSHTPCLLLSDLLTPAPFISSGASNWKGQQGLLEIQRNKGYGQGIGLGVLPEVPSHRLLESLMCFLFTVGTKIIADPEKCFQELISEKLLIFYCGMGPVWN